MCGIAGWFGPPDPFKLNRMITALKHRGPDESGSWIGELASLGIARLAIINVREGQQPVYSESKSVIAVVNGEIYNFEDLRSHLQARGVVCKPGSDAEVIPGLYELYGLDFVQHLRGMFAIALWDSRTNSMVLARDRVGKKPLWFTHASERILFASEAKSLLSSGWDSPVDFNSLDSVLAYGYIPPASGAWKMLRSVPPGHIASISGGEIRIAKYWEWPLEPRTRKSSATEKQHQLVELDECLNESVRIRLLSERPLGAFLSGGIDSSIVTALMCRNQTIPVETFSIGFKDQKYDESQYAKSIAQYLGTAHTEYILEPDPESIVAELGDIFDQPLADSSAIPTLMLSQLARRKVVVALSGDGGDEAFGGYMRYWAAPLIRRCNPLLTLVSPLRPLFDSLSRRSSSRRLARLERNLAPISDLGSIYLRLMTWATGHERQELWTNEIQSQLDTNATDQGLRDVWDSLRTLTPMNQMRAMDMQTYLPADLMVKVDMASMSCSLEVRCPLLDQEVLALAGRLSGSELISGRSTKNLLREYAYTLIPKRLLDRPKMGFAIPRASWLRGPLREMARDLLLSESARNRNWFNQTYLEECFRMHDHGINKDAILWPAMMIELWAQRWVDYRVDRISS